MSGKRVIGGVLLVLGSLAILGWISALIMSSQLRSLLVKSPLVGAGQILVPVLIALSGFYLVRGSES